MFKEIVSLAIILGFILNILFVEHPNSSTYTISFVFSLSALSPFVLLWQWKFGSAERIQKNVIGSADASLVEVVVAGLAVAVESPVEVDVEKGIVEESGCEVDVEDIS